ncbi:hypothetical protein [Microbacterium sp. A93]|uniref:hypothetical protein n=1 Tax=Microbacterium sp. A93 TaxID=3450716 RepID=UPI003F41F4ED
MHEPFADDDIRAVQAADPAEGAVASAALRARVAGIPAVARTVPVRRGRRWLVPIAAAGMVLAAIGGGYIWGTGGIHFGPAPVLLAVETGAPNDPAAPIELGDAGNGSGVGGAELQVGAQANAMPGFGWWGYPNRHRFIVPAFDPSPSQAKVFAVDAGVQYSAEDAARMASVLGVTGEVRANEFGGGWVLGDYSGAYFDLSVWGTASFNGGILDPVVVCEDAATALHGREKLNDDGTWAFGQEMIRCMADTPLPSDELVHESVTLFLAAIGLDEDAVEITAVPDDAGRNVTVTAARIVENNVTEIAAHVTVSAQGIMNASGPIGEVVSLGEYPIVSHAEAAARLNDPAFSPRLVSAPDQIADPGEYIPPTAPAKVPDAGSAVPWRIDEHEIVSARLGLALLNGENGEQYLAPTYEFTAADDTVWSVVALAEDELDTTTTARG